MSRACKIGDRIEDHCFNIVEAKDEYRIIDISLPIERTNDNDKLVYKPFIGKIDKSNINKVLTENLPLLCNVGNNNVSEAREYVAGGFSYDYKDTNKISK